MPPIIVLITTCVGTVIRPSSGLAFLGLGVPPPSPTWGAMLSGGGRTVHAARPLARVGAWPVRGPRWCMPPMCSATRCAICSIPRMRGSR